MENHSSQTAKGSAGRQQAQQQRQAAAAALLKAQLAAGAASTPAQEQLPALPEWGQLEPSQRQKIQAAFKTAALAMAIRQLSDSRGITAAQQLRIWGQG